MTMGRRIQMARKKAGLTQKQLAEKCKLATGTIQQYELKREPRTEQQLKICNELNISLYELVDAQGMISNAEKILDNFGREMSENIAFQNEPKEKNLIHQYRKLNNSGKDEAIKRVEELTEIKKYTENEE